MKLGYLGLGKMGGNMVERLREKGHEPVTYNRHGDGTAKTLEEIIAALPAPRTIWFMVPAANIDDALSKMVPLMSPGDTIIDGGNTHYKDTVERAAKLKAQGFSFIDVGVSGGPGGARNGACLMIGGNKQDYEKYESLWKDLSVENGYGYMGEHGAGHFVKMVHNGIEYGMMQSIAEGFAVMQASPLKLRLDEIAHVYNHGSVVESRLTSWLEEAFTMYGTDLASITSTVAHTGEGQWTVDAARELGVPAKVIEDSLQFRIDSEKNPSFAGKVLSALRNRFGGHDAAATN